MDARCMGIAHSKKEARRAYIHSFCDADEYKNAANVIVEMLSPGATYGSVGPTDLPGKKAVPWELAPQRLNELLCRIRTLG